MMDKMISLFSGGPNIAFNLNNLSNNSLSLDTFSGHPFPEEMISPTGWVFGADGILFWVPEDCHHGLTCSAIMTIPTTGPWRCVQIDFTLFRCGTSWTSAVFME